MEIKTHSWASLLGEEKKKPYFQKILSFIDSERKLGKTIYPTQANMFNALRLTPFANVKVVLLGQDPYHGPHQAHGLSFSVLPGIAPPPSLINIYKELESDLNLKRPQHGCLEAWARQGVLLLNASLSVEAGNPQSHATIGWEQFTDRVIDCLNEHPESIVFLLWGSSAQKKASLINTTQHSILKAPHPSPLSAHRGFFGCRHFSQANKILSAKGREPIDWRL